MGLWTGSLLYVALRTLVAVAFAVLALRVGRGGWMVSGQAVSDAASTMFLLAYVNWEVREALGPFAVPLFAFVIGWEGVGLMRQLPVGGDSADDLSANVFETLMGAWKWAWGALYVVPPVVAGAFVVFDLLSPAQWPFPSQRPALYCTPTTLDAHDTVTLEMLTPHGAELGVFLPDGRFLTVVPYAPATTPRVQRFEYHDRLKLPVAAASGTVTGSSRPVPVFADSGTYVFRLSDLAELSASQTCSVRFTGS